MSCFSWYHIHQMHLVLDALESQRSIEEPNFTKRVIMGYLETKLKRAMPLSRVDEKFTILEQAMYQRRLPDFTKQIVEIRAQLNLPPSKVYPRSRRASRNPPPIVSRCPPTYSIVNSDPPPNSRPTRPPPHPYLYLPLCSFKDEDELPVYTPYQSNPVRRLQESLI